MPFVLHQLWSFIARGYTKLRKTPGHPAAGLKYRFVLLRDGLRLLRGVPAGVGFFTRPPRKRSGDDRYQQRYWIVC